MFEHQQHYFITDYSMQELTIIQYYSYVTMIQFPTIVPPTYQLTCFHQQYMVHVVAEGHMAQSCCAVTVQ
jgi:hypothetical protein